MNEKTDTWRQAHDRLMEENLALKQQLAAVRGAQHHMEACRTLLNVPDDEVLYGAIEELKAQLAAEREKGKQLLQQLDDADLEVQTLVDALAKIRDMTPPYHEAPSIAEVALAKIGGEK